MQNQNSIMVTFFIGTMGIMLVLSGIIFLVYCLFYEVKNKKKVYKESKLLVILCIIIGIIMAILSFLYFNQNLVK